MISIKVGAICATILLTATLAPAQQSFPLKPGEWEAVSTFSKTKDSPMKSLLCLNDEKWDQVLLADMAGSDQYWCSERSVHPSKEGISMSGSCSLITGTGLVPQGSTNLDNQLTAEHNYLFDIGMSFEGTTHMAGKGTLLDKVTFTPIKQSGRDYIKEGPPRTETHYLGDIQVDYRWMRDTCGRKSTKSKEKIGRPYLH